MRYVRTQIRTHMVRATLIISTKENAIGGAPVNDKNILVCVTQQKTCEHLITLASKIERGDGSIYVLHVLGNNDKFLNTSRESEALDYLFSVSKTIGAAMTVLRSDDTIESIADFIRSKSIQIAILGESHDVRKDTETFSTVLYRKVNNCEILTV